MANVFAIHSVCRSIAAFLQDSYPASVAELPLPPCSFEVLSSSQMAGPLVDASRIGLYLHRTTISEHSRAQRPGRITDSRPAPLHLDLHFIVASWSRSAHDEQVTMAWTQRQLHLHPMLDFALLTAEGAWAADEVIQIVPAELSAEDTLRLWATLGAPYRLSAPYTARVVRLDADQPLPDAPPVLVINS
jgi:hypothetical protein